MQQIYAKIKKSSQYYGQTRPGERFPVHIERQGQWEHMVHGNHNEYRLSDVNLFVVGKDSREWRIS